MVFFKPNIEKLEAEKDIRGLVKALYYRNAPHYKYEDYRIKEKAAEVLGRMGKSAIASL